MGFQVIRQLRLESLNKPASFYIAMSYQPKCLSFIRPFEGQKVVWYKPGVTTWFVMKYPRGSMEPDMDISGHRDVNVGVEPSQWDMHEDDERVFIVETMAYALSVG